MKQSIITRRDALKKIGIISVITPGAAFILNETLSPSLNGKTSEFDNREDRSVSDSGYHRCKSRSGWISVYCSTLS